jgi:hypothetical protein
MQVFKHPQLIADSPGVETGEHATTIEQVSNSKTADAHGTRNDISMIFQILSATRPGGRCLPDRAGATQDESAASETGIFQCRPTRSPGPEKIRMQEIAKLSPSVDGNDESRFAAKLAPHVNHDSIQAVLFKQAIKSEHVLLPEVARDPDAQADTLGLLQALGQTLVIQLRLRYAGLVREATADNAEVEITHAANS